MRAVSEVVSPVPQAGALTRGQPVLVCFNPSLARPGLLCLGSARPTPPVKEGMVSHIVLVVAKLPLLSLLLSCVLA